MQLANHDIGHEHAYFRNWVTPRVDTLLGFGVPAKAIYQDQFIADKGEDFRVNTWLRSVYDVISMYRVNGDFMPGNVDDLAQSLAEKFGPIVKAIDAGLFAMNEILQGAGDLLELHGLPWPAGENRLTQVRRLQDAKWWRRRINAQVIQAVDQSARDLRRVKKGEECYLSDAAFQMYKDKVELSREMLGKMSATNEHGQEYSLADLSELGQSNPKHRFTEMMVRMRGIEKKAVDTGCTDGIFVTITCPSSYHLYKKGSSNDRYNGASPRLANDYLCNVWVRIRALLAKEGIDYFGVRVSEPHHDGCPHWHLGIQIEAGRGAEVREIITRYGLMVDGGESGAKRYRVKIEKIDGRGIAGYLAKYISKSIEGTSLGADGDGNGNTGSIGASRVVAWSRVWNIRQFQFFGLEKVGIYRELRRVARGRVPVAYMAAWEAADGGDYAEFGKQTKAAGIALYRAPWFDETDGETANPYNGFGELKPDPVRGLVSALLAAPLITRLMQWSLSFASDSAQPWTRVNNCNECNPVTGETIIFQAIESAKAVMVGGGALEFDDYWQYEALH